MRLATATLDRLPGDIGRPGYDRATEARGIVHLGIGAFHRAHQAVFTDAAMRGGDHGWAITGVSLRAPGVRDALAPQDGLYTVTERDAATTRTQLIGAVTTLLVAPERPVAVEAAIAAPDTRIISLTVTEKGYYRRPDGALDIAAVTAAGDTLYHYLARGLARRRAAGLPGVTLLCCDNLSDNGRVLGGALAAWLDHAAPDLLGWFEAECACPSTMVDRIVPATTDADRADIAARLGLDDAGAVITEPFRQWVIEDRFAGPRPRWDSVGAELVADAKPYETAKLRMLNGAHSALSYLGIAAGLDYVHQAIADPAIHALVEQLMRREAAPTIAVAPGQDLAAYADALLQRFANTALPHSLRQIATDGSQKIAQRWLEPLAINRARGLTCPATLRALAAWVRFVRGDAGRVDDPMAAELAALWQLAGADGIVDALFGTGGLLTPRWAADDASLAMLRQFVRGA